MKPKTKYRSHASALLLFKILQKDYLKRSFIFYEGILPCIISTSWINICHNCHSHLKSSCVRHVVIYVYRKLKITRLVSPPSHNVRTKFRGNWSTVSKIKKGHSHRAGSPHNSTFFLLTKVSKLKSSKWNYII